MRIKFLSMFAMALLVSACSTHPDTTYGIHGYGSGMSATQTADAGDQFGAGQASNVGVGSAPLAEPAPLSTGMTDPSVTDYGTAIDPVDPNAYGTDDLATQQARFAQEVGDVVYFAYDSSALSADARSTLQRQANWLKQYPAINVTVEGHCDERGTREYNLALGERRANSIKSYLSSLGVSANRIGTVSYGKERPAVLGSNAAAWAKNRRGITVIE